MGMVLSKLCVYWYCFLYVKAWSGSSPLLYCFCLYVSCE